MQNFMLSDLSQTTLAIFAFALFLFPSGYLLGLGSNVFNFRGRTAAEQMLFGVTLSIATTPVIAVLISRASSYRVTIAFFLLLALVAIGTLICQISRTPRSVTMIRRSTWIFLGLMLAWFLVVQLSLADMQWGHRLYVSYVAYDHSVRVPLVEAFSRNGVPSPNPFCGLGRLPVLRYYYYWYVVCALPVRLFGLGAKACFNASVIWSGLGLASLIPLYLKYFLGEAENLRKKSLIGIALLAVTGLDLLPYLVEMRIYGEVPGDMEWWDPNQVTSWIASMLWVPHHVAALIACMVGLLVLSTITESSELGQRIWAVALSGACLASAAGLSVYVTFTFALFFVYWTLRELSLKHVKTFIVYISAGAFSLLLSWPYLLDLLSRPVEVGMNSGEGERFAVFAIRTYPQLLSFLGRAGNIHSSLALELLKVPLLLFLYILEFGFFFLIVPLRFRQESQKSEPRTSHRMAWVMLVICLVTMSILQSNATNSNDLGFRGMLVVQFVLLIWAAPIVHDFFFREDGILQRPFRARWIKVSLLSTILIGLAGTTYELVMLRCYAPLADKGKIKRTELFLGESGFAERTYWLREGFHRIAQSTPSTASVQYNPVRDEVAMSHLYSPRRAIMGDAFCVTSFGGDAETCRKEFPRVAEVFNDPLGIKSGDLDAFCSDLHINILAVVDTDPVWRDHSTWVWSRPAVVSNPSMRAIPCGEERRPSEKQ